MVHMRGIVVPLITPLHPDQTLDQEALCKLVDHVIAGGVAGLFALGSSGEGPTLPTPMREEVVRVVSKAAAGRLPVVAGVFALGTRAAVLQARRLAELGADGVAVTAPYYFTHTQEEIYSHISAVAKSIPIPTLVYNIPQMVQTVIEPSTLERLAELPELIGMKDSAGDMLRFQQYLALQHDGFSVYQGAESMTALSLMLGAHGAVLGLANVAPALCRGIYDAVKQDDKTEALRLQRQLLVLWKLHTHGQWLPCLKAAVNQLSICGPTPYAPFIPVDAATALAVREDMLAAHVLSTEGI